GRVGRSVTQRYRSDPRRAGRVTGCVLPRQHSHFDPSVRQMTGGARRRAQPTANVGRAIVRSSRPVTRKNRKPGLTSKTQAGGPGSFGASRISDEHASHSRGCEDESSRRSLAVSVQRGEPTPAPAQTQPPPPWTPVARIFVPGCCEKA